ncbi:MAG: hypothetical protein HDR74_05440 [Bacteroides sp.]|nr:hypothetical protein [Bacteroidales bacterium]MBD5379324.1 hypothetical protein [Bacteroides sp.]MDE5809309.1 hypothetical protein [Muribaculaceae bacterium]MDE6225105.1 hypothetical protein [Muribaculaceae bacterium]
MTELNKLQAKVNVPGSKGWKGYTLKELEFRKDVNMVKQHLLLERIGGVTGMLKSKGLTGLSLVGKMDSIMTMVNYGMIAFKVYSSVKSIFRKRNR